MKHTSRIAENNLKNTVRLQTSAWAYPVLVWTVLALCTSNKSLNQLNREGTHQPTEEGKFAVESRVISGVENSVALGNNIPELGSKNTLQ